MKNWQDEKDQIITRPETPEERAAWEKASEATNWFLFFAFIILPVWVFGGLFVLNLVAPQ